MPTDEVEKCKKHAKKGTSTTSAEKATEAATVSSIIQQKARRAAEAKFEKYANGKTDGFHVLVETAWAGARSAFESHEDTTGHGIFVFEVSAKGHPEITRTHVYDMMRTMDDFKDDISPGRVLVDKKGADDEARFEICIVYGNLRDVEFDTLVDEHRAKKRRADALLKEERTDALLK